MIGLREALRVIFEENCYSFVIKPEPYGDSDQHSFLVNRFEILLFLHSSFPFVGSIFLFPCSRILSGSSMVTQKRKWLYAC